MHIRRERLRGTTIHGVNTKHGDAQAYARNRSRRCRHKAWVQFHGQRLLKLQPSPHSQRRLAFKVRRSDRRGRPRHQSRPTDDLLSDGDDKNGYCWRSSCQHHPGVRDCDSVCYLPKTVYHYQRFATRKKAHRLPDSHGTSWKQPCQGICSAVRIDNNWWSSSTGIQRSWRERFLQATWHPAPFHIGNEVNRYWCSVPWHRWAEASMWRSRVLGLLWNLFHLGRVDTVPDVWGCKRSHASAVITLSVQASW